MRIDFLNNPHKEAPRSDELFGLCDDQQGAKAYSNTDKPEQWIATISNMNGLELVFIPVDNCLIKSDELPSTGRCDGLLLCPNSLFFVELKNQRADWIQDAIKQLEDTIKLFIENHNIMEFRHRKAYACNKRRPRFQELDNELKIRFFRTYGVRLDVQAKIIVVGER